MSLPESPRPTALVTGASRGIGRAVAVELGRLGYDIAINYAGNHAAAEEALALVIAAGGKGSIVQADIGSMTDCERLINTVAARYGRLDLLVNNAGITSPGRLDLLSATEENWDRVFAVNLKGPFFLTQAAAKLMIQAGRAGLQSGGKIVTISSISSYTASTDRGDYCLSKAALGMMTALFAARLAEHGILAYEIRPGVIATDMTAVVKEKYDRLFAAGMAPQAHWGEPNDIARCVSALAQGYFPYSTGQVFNVDGGYHLRRL